MLNQVVSDSVSQVYNETLKKKSWTPKLGHRDFNERKANAFCLPFVWVSKDAVMFGESYLFWVL